MFAEVSGDLLRLCQEMGKELGKKMQKSDNEGGKGLYLQKRRTTLEGKTYVNQEKNVYPGADGGTAYDAFRIF